MLLKHKKGSNVSHIEERPYQVATWNGEIKRKTGNRRKRDRQVCSVLMYWQKEGYRPLVLERGADVEKRKSDVDHFWETGVLNPDSNVQFGEGGAGTFRTES